AQQAERGASREQEYQRRPARGNDQAAEGIRAAPDSFKSPQVEPRQKRQSGRDRSSALTTGPSISPRLRVDKRDRPKSRTHGARAQTASATASTVAARASQGVRSVTSTGGNAGRATAA